MDIWKNRETMPVQLVNLLTKLQDKAGADAGLFARLVVDSYASAVCDCEDVSATGGDYRKRDDLRDWLISQLS